jgi:Sodium/calcium exchanger protein
VLHYICITWKLLFAFVPPPRLGGGLPCFLACLAGMAGATYLLTNFATMFGCAVGLSNLMTALTFLAVGTSLPTAFGSVQVSLAKVPRKLLTISYILQCAKAELLYTTAVPPPVTHCAIWIASCQSGKNGL